MAIRERWNRMLHKSASVTSTFASPSSSSGSSSPSSPVSAPTSPGAWTVVSGFNWSTSTSTKSSSSSSGSSGSRPDRGNQHQLPPPPTPPAQRPKPQKKPKKPSSYHHNARTHPSERPMTDENLRYQEMLAGFTLTFGSSSGGGGGGSLDDDEVSPCDSRRGSMVDPLAAPPRAFPAAP